MVLGKKVNPYAVDIKVMYIRARKHVNIGIEVKMKECHYYAYIFNHSDFKKS